MKINPDVSNVKKKQNVSKKKQGETTCANRSEIVLAVPGINKSGRALHAARLDSWKLITVMALVQLSRDHCHLQFTDGFGDLDIPGAGHRAVEGCVATSHAVRFTDDCHTLCSTLVPAVEDEAMSGHQRGRAEVFVAAPEGRTGCGAGRTQDAFGRVIEAGALFG